MLSLILAVIALVCAIAAVLFTNRKVEALAIGIVLLALIHILAAI